MKTKNQQEYWSNFMDNNVRLVLDSIHPLSRIKTELVWEEKYDEYSKYRTVDIASCTMPPKKVETINDLTFWA